MIRVKEHVLCPACNRGVLQFYVPPFANGMVKEYCPVCDGKESKLWSKKYASDSGHIDSIRPINRGSAYCIDCGKELPVRRRGRKRLRCVRDAHLWKVKNQAIQRQETRERWMPMVNEIASDLRQRSGMAEAAA